MSRKKPGTRQKLLLDLIYEEPFITYDELTEEVQARTTTRGQHLSITLGAIESRGWIMSKNESYIITREGKSALGV